MCLRASQTVSIALFLALTAVPAAAQTVAFDGTVHMSQGRYTLDETVTSAFVVGEFSVSSSLWWATLTIPVIYQDSPDLGYVGGMPMPWMRLPDGMDDDHHGGGGMGGGHGGGGMGGDHGSEDRDFEKFGLSDPRLSAGTVLFRDVFDRNIAGPVISAKAPVADESRGFGSGEWDFGFGAFWNRSTSVDVAFAEVSYWVLGDPPESDFRNPIAAEFAYGRSLAGGRFFVAANLWGRSSAVEGTRGPAAVGIRVERMSGNRHNVYFSAEAGLTETAPDYSLAVGYRSVLYRP